MAKRRENRTLDDWKVMAEVKLNKLIERGKQKWEIKKDFVAWNPPREVWDWLAGELNYQPGWAYYAYTEAQEKWAEKEADKERQTRLETNAEEARMRAISHGNQTQWLVYEPDAAPNEAKSTLPVKSASAFQSVSRGRR